MRKVLLDVGGHIGETVEALLEDCPFDVVFTFEPSALARKTLELVAARSDRVVVCPFGLSDRDETRILYGSGTIAASVLSESVEGPTETVRLRKVGKWMDEALFPDDRVFLKLNCEGSEVNIMKELKSSGGLERIYAMMLDIDARKYETARSEGLALEREIRELNNPLFCLCEDVMIGSTHAHRIHNWLRYVGAWDDEPAGPAIRIARKFRYSTAMRARAWMIRRAARIRSS